MLDRKEHWENIHATKLSTEVSWYQPEPKRSVELISSVSTPASRVIDVGGGQFSILDWPAGWRQRCRIDARSTSA